MKEQIESLPKNRAGRGPCGVFLLCRLSRNNVVLSVVSRRRQSPLRYRAIRYRVTLTSRDFSGCCAEISNVVRPLIVVGVQQLGGVVRSVEEEIAKNAG